METENFVELTAKLILLASTTNDQEKSRLKKEIAALSQQESHEEKERFLKFTEKEISKMPKQFRKDFRTDGLRAHIRKRIRGNSINYEIRCRKNGYNISASGVTIEEAKQRFIEKLYSANEEKELEKVPTTFDEFALYYFENYKKRKVKESTYKNDLGRLKKHLLPYFNKVPLKTITPSQCQKLIDKFTDEGKGKTADEIHSILNGIFKYAIAHGIIIRNPLATVFHQQHEREHGKALTKEEESILPNKTNGTERLCFAIALYAGLRPNEYKTISRNRNMLIAINSKRKNRKVEYKRIPINPMLAPIIGNTNSFNFPCHKALWKKYKTIFPNSTLYDLRTTFYTRCKECGIADSARDEMVGHSLGILGNTYTDLSDEYLISEAQKFKYDLPPFLPPKQLNK